MIGAVRLRVADLDRAVAYYERVIGLRTLERQGPLARLGADGPLVELEGDPSARPAPVPSTGLFHLAVLVPDRPELVRAVRRVAHAGARLEGASDHFVSEAVYLRDPEGNGIELYHDRPREVWEWTADGELVMGTVPLDLGAMLAEDPGGPDPGMPAGTVIGHVHLQVADLDAAETFYTAELGLDVTVRRYPGARFMSRGGYHHHVGVNTWAGEGAPAPPPGSRGLVHYEARTPGAQERLLADPSGHRVLVRGS